MSGAPGSAGVTALIVAAGFTATGTPAVCLGMVWLPTFRTFGFESGFESGPASVGASVGTLLTRPGAPGTKDLPLGAESTLATGFGIPAEEGGSSRGGGGTCFEEAISSGLATR